ncbi:MAG: cupredoxin domain-containing protein [Vicinamibacterales bacterium]
MQGTPDVQEARITAGDTSFEPSRLTLREGVPARLMFTRTSEKTCPTSVFFASLKIKKKLPFNEPRHDSSSHQARRARSRSRVA